MAPILIREQSDGATRFIAIVSLRKGTIPIDKIRSVSEFGRHLTGPYRSVS